MADNLSQSSVVQNNASSASTVVTVTETTDSQSQAQELPTVHLKLTKPKGERKVQWTTETIDNEEMDKKKSKCCCIYKKPKAFGESSSSSSDSSDDEDCEHHGHVDRKKKTKLGEPIGGNRNIPKPSTSNQNESNVRTNGTESINSDNTTTINQKKSEPKPKNDNSIDGNTSKP